jgi:hypothetical protein
MIAIRPARTVLLLLAAALAVGLPAVQGEAKPRKPVEASPPPPVVQPPPPILGVALNSRMLNDAAAYQAYMIRASAISPAFGSGADVAAALRNGAAYEPQALIRGAMAAGAIAALQEPAFVASVRAAGANSNSRRLLLNRVIAEPGYIFTFPGSAAATRNVKQAIGGAGLRLLSTGAAVKQSAYDIQHQAWSKEFVVDRDARLAAVKSGSSTPPPPAPDIAAGLTRGITGGAPLGLGNAPIVSFQTPMIAKAMALAAFAALGEAGDANYERLTYLTSETNTGYCLSMAKLNLNQCLAVAKPHYEDVFCLGQHVLSDTGMCLARAGGGLMVLEVRARPIKLPPPKVGARSGRPTHRHR